MKTLKSVMLSFFMLFAASAFSQVSVSVNVGTPPPWGPVGYTEVRYYYIPEIEVYYDVHQSQYIYFNNGKWYRKRNLPGRFRSYDLYSGYKVVLTDYYGPTPYVHFSTHQVKYHKGYRGSPQKTIGVKPGNKKAAVSKNTKNPKNSNAKAPKSNKKGKGKKN